MKTFSSLLIDFAFMPVNPVGHPVNPVSHPVCDPVNPVSHPVCDPVNPGEVGIGGHPGVTDRVTNMKAVMKK